MSVFKIGSVQIEIMRIVAASGSPSPTFQEIAERLGCKQQGVHRAFVSLQAKGLMSNKPWTPRTHYVTNRGRSVLDFFDRNKELLCDNF